MPSILELVRDTDPVAFAEAADGWGRLAAALDRGLDLHIERSGRLSAAWPSGTAAEKRAVGFRTEIAGAYEPCRRISAALRTQADTIYRLQDRLADLLAECDGNGLAVDLTIGVLSVKSGAVLDTAQAARLPGLMQGYHEQLTAIVAQAVDVDLETRAVLQVWLPEPGSGFGGPAGPVLTEADVRAQQGLTPIEVALWWQSLTRSRQDQVTRDFPELIGVLDGVPAEDRDTANRAVLAEQRQRVEAAMSASGSWDAADPELEEQRQRIQKIDDTLTGLGDRGYLLGFDTEAYSGHGKVIIAVGNPDTARHTGVWVPGLSTTPYGSMDQNIDRVLNLNDAADGISKGRAGDVSTVYWLGYDAPDMNDSTVFENGRAASARDPYLNFMQGLRATHEGEPGHLVAMGHSYGSTVVGEAAATGRLPVDDIVVAGSPGTHVDNAGQLMADPRHVWAGVSRTDWIAEPRNLEPVSNAALYAALGPGFGPALSPVVLAGIEDRLSGTHGPEPTDSGFGGNNWVVDTEGHTHYWDRESESLNNQARILAGTYSRVTLDSGQGPEDAL